MGQVDELVNEEAMLFCVRLDPFLNQSLLHTVPSYSSGR